MNQSTGTSITKPDGTDGKWGGKEKAVEALWDPSAFESQKLGQWNEKSKEHGKNVTRLQDLSLGIGSGHQKKDPAKEDSWPYESSPCRMFGGKNTKPGGEAMNKELFDPDFANGQARKDSLDFDEEGEFTEEVNEDYGMEAVAEETSDGEPEKPQPPEGLEHRSRRMSNGPQSTTTARRTELKANVVRASMMGERNAYNQVVDRGLTRSNSDPKLDKMGKPGKKRDELAVSCHAGIESSKSRNKPSKKAPSRGDEKGSASTADTASTAGAGGPVSYSRSGAPSRIPPRRTRTGDGLEDLSRHRANTRDEMTSSGHGDSSRRGDRPRRKPKPVDRRSLMTRAMSTQNVKKPEDYGPRATGGDAEDELGGTSHHEKRRVSGRRRMQVQRTASQRSLSKDRKGRSSRHNSDSDSEGEESAKSGDMPDIATSEPEVRRDVSERRLIRQSSRRVRGTSSRTLEPKRDLLILLRDQKPVTQKDLKDKENRRLLHFLIYEHKMGISLGELGKMILKEKEDGVEPDRRQRLYIDTD